LKKIAVLGGGIAALTTAYELSQSPELRARYQVDVYQLGFRLGGKLASGRDRAQGRNLEHGLHVWFGCYENAFGLLRALYRDWQKDPRSPFQRWTDAIAPRPYVPVGEQQGDDFFVHQREWVVAEGTPGEGDVEITLAFLLSYLDDLLGRPRWLGLIRRGLGPRLSQLSLDPSHFTGGQCGADAPLGAARPPSTRYQLARALLRFVRQRIRRQNQRESAEGAELDSDARRRMGERVYAELLLTTLIGVLDPRYGVVHGEGLASLNEWDFRHWLALNGASDACLASSFVSLLYEAAFSCVDGDAEAPSMEAGTAVNIVVRLFTYKGAILWEVRAGMGDVLIAPLYELLCARGVRFHFFHKVTNLSLSEDKTQVEHVEIGVQARTADGQPYAPLLRCDYTPVWPSEPLWEQLDQGDALRARGVDFESHWCQEPFVEIKRLERGRDFDAVVLALALGAFKPLNHEPGPCRELIAHSPRFARMVHALPIMPTQALQLWFDLRLDQLGYDWGGAACEAEPVMVNSPKPYTAWADMTGVLQFEHWRHDRPRSLHYLCGMLTTDLYRRPSSAAETPREAQALARHEALRWLRQEAPRLWPALSNPVTHAFEWNALHAAFGVEGEARLDAQYVRANVNPSDCTVAVAAGSSKFRLGADESGFANLYLAGAWTRTPVFVECVEGAVMSGKAAARAISAIEVAIPGEGWLWSRASSAQEPVVERLAAE
jgi:uncharacterized protein with NAD-binding domain and iron-sulfur cluster